MRQMKKFTMSKLLKYFCLIALGFCIYSMYEKIMDASKASEKTDGSNDNFMENVQQRLDDDNDGAINEARDIRERHVKEHINKVFEEFKQEQENKNKLEKEKDAFQDYVDNIEKNNDDGVADTGLDDINEVNVDINDVQGNTFDDADDDDNDDNNFDESINDDNFDGNAANDDNVAEDDEIDEEKEREELEAEKEIEERIAGAIQDAHEEVKEEELGMGQNEGENNENNINAQLAKDNVGVAKNMEIPNAQQAFERKEFNKVVEKVGRRLNPREIRYLKERAARFVKMNDEDHEFPPFVTAARQTTFTAVKQLAASIQIHAPGKMLYIFSLDLTKEEKDELATYCNVRVRTFMKDLFPEHISDLDNLYWKPLVMQIALAEYVHMIWVNPGFRLASQELAPLVHESHENGIVILGQTTSYSTYAATHPNMLKFMPVDNEKLALAPHIEVRAIFIHNSDEVHKNFMEMFTSCGLEKTCLAPKGSQWQCKFDLTGRKPAGCHRYDESAINILVKNWFDFDLDKFARRNEYFKKVDKFIQSKPKVCRKADDARDHDL